MPADLGKVDLIIQYALLVAGQEDGAFDRQLGPIHLIKYVYLADLFHASANEGEIFTGVDWTFYKFGPWSQMVNERIEPALLLISADMKRFDSQYGDEDWVRWSLNDERLLDEKQGKLPASITMHLRREVHRYLKDTPSLLDFVYKTPPMIHAAPGEILDFTKALVEKRSSAENQPLKMQSLSNKQAKKFRDKMSGLRAAFHEKKGHVKLVPPATTPRYDEVFEEGVKWLDGLAGEKFEDKDLVAEFSSEVWKSSSRSGNDIS